MLQCTVTHDKKFIHVTPGFQGARNDKTNVHFDSFINKLRYDPAYTELKYELIGVDEPISGAYVLSDGGYHAWRALQFPLRHCGGDRDLARWSRRLESVRKDVECSFGMLKGRFRVLKSAITIRDKTQVDNIFYTCCVLHNHLIVADGRDLENWDLQGRHGTFGGDGIIDAHDDFVEFAGREDLDLAHQGGFDVSAQYEMEHEDEHDELRDQLVAHFTAQYKAGDVEWINSKESDTADLETVTW